METTQHGLQKPDSKDIYPFNTNVNILEEHLSDTDIHVNASKIAKIVEPDVLTQIDSDDTNSTLWGKIKKSISVLKEHVDKVASETTLGHVKIGTGLQMTDDVANVKIANDLMTHDASTALSAEMGTELNTSIVNTNSKLEEHVEKVASESTLGHIKIGIGLQMTDDLASVKIANDLVTEDSTTALSSNMGVELNKKIEEHAEKVASETTLGHIKIGTGLQMSNDTALVKIANNLITNDSSMTLSAVMGKSLNDNKAPNNHASTVTTYGVGNVSNFGHVKLSDNYTSSAGAASAGVGASSTALADAYNTLNANLNWAYVQLKIATDLILNSAETFVNIPFNTIGAINNFGRIGWLTNGIFTANKSCTVEVAAAIVCKYQTGWVELALFKNNGFHSTAKTEISTNFDSVSYSPTILELVAGDTIAFQVKSEKAGLNLHMDQFASRMSIKQIK